MAGTKEIRTKIKSVQNTRKITKAMQMVAAAKLRRAQEAAEMARPYAERMGAVMSGLAGSVAGAAVGAAVAVPVIGSGLIEEVESRHLTISWTSFALAVLVGTVVTLVSILRPARQASRVSALMALTGQTAGHHQSAQQQQCGRDPTAKPSARLAGHRTPSVLGLFRRRTHRRVDHLTK